VQYAPPYGRYTRLGHKFYNSIDRYSLRSGVSTHRHTVGKTHLGRKFFNFIGRHSLRSGVGTHRHTVGKTHLGRKFFNYIGRYSRVQVPLRVTIQSTKVTSVAFTAIISQTSIVNHLTSGTRQQ
jgi:hypothetical protein